MKELTLDEVLRIAGGLPNLAALDELNYEVAQSPPMKAEPSTSGHDATFDSQSS